MKNFLLLIILSLFISTAYGQFYEKQIGIRLGVTSGISGKVIKDKRAAIEGMLGFRKGGLQMYGLLEAYRSMLDDYDHDLRIYFGGGGHVGWVNGTFKNYFVNDSQKSYEEEYIVGPVFGLDGVFGTEYTFRGVPIVIGIEFKPYIELISFYKLKVNFWDFGFNLKYRF